MAEFAVVPKISTYKTFAAYCAHAPIEAHDLVFAAGSACRRMGEYFKTAAAVVDFSKYPSGEPTDSLVEAIANDIAGTDYKRVVGIGGGTVLDVAKLFALKTVTPVTDLFLKKFPPKREKRLVLIPTTCGTGSEMTNISILELTAIQSKFGLAVPELFADEAILIPELIENLPRSVFATSSIDALIHSIESFISPKAGAFTKLFSQRAMTMILNGYQLIAEKGEGARFALSEDFLLASAFAGIAFGNAGCAAVHAMSYPLGTARHVPHGEANYAMFSGVYKTYQKMKPNGSIQELNALLSDILSCDEAEVYDALDRLLNKILQKKSLREYGVSEAELAQYTQSVFEKQQRLLANNYVPFDEAIIKEIYLQLY
ncbi:MAG: 4-hydroxybutyrate dehydrogenase [Oscillospiraceae bacterium]|jgi:4-hydroxybutyrate dehydrogenase|nr:4-hydroxybutyrate dehydrogenase [Oscillospiraceae bacterium]